MAFLSAIGLVHIVAWQAERKSAWLLTSSWMTCLSRSHMMLLCSLCSNLAWEAFWASASLIAIAHAALFSHMEHVQVILASLTISKQMALASRVVQEQMSLTSLTVAKHKAWASRLAWEQMALASLMDSIALDSFWWSSMPNSQMALCLQASMDALVVSSSLRALLAFVQSSTVSNRGVMLSDLEVIAMGEMLVGIPSRDVSAISMLTWDEISTSWSSSFGWWEEASELSFQTCGQTFPVSLRIRDPSLPWSCCPLPLILVGWTCGDWLLWWWKPCQKAVPSGLAPPPGVVGC